MRMSIHKLAAMVVGAVVSMDAMLSSSAFSFVGRRCSHHYPPAARSRISTSTSTSTTSLRGIDYEAIENGSAAEYSDFDTNMILLPMPNELMTPEEVVSTCMSYLQTNSQHAPSNENAGLEICYNFSSDSCRMANGGSLESFLQYANNPVFQSMVDCDKWGVLNVGSEIPGTNTRGAMQTVLIHVVPKKIEGAKRNDRKFLWTLMKERRPPRQGYFLVHECIAVDNAFAQTM